MTDLRTAAKQALEALEFFWDNGYRNIAMKQKAAITALCAALAEPVQEPVAVVRSVVGQGDDGVRIKWLSGFAQIGDRLYTAPPQRKPLPASEIVTMYDESPTGDSDMIAFARAIERAHGIT